MLIAKPYFTQSLGRDVAQISNTFFEIADRFDLERCRGYGDRASGLLDTAQVEQAVCVIFQAGSL